MRHGFMILAMAFGANGVLAAELVAPSVDDAILREEREAPAGLLRRGERARVGARVTVTYDGQAESCEVIMPSTYPALDALTCRLYREEGRFRPAQGPFGRPIRGILDTGMIWEARATATDAATSRARAPERAGSVGKWLTARDLRSDALRPGQVSVTILQLVISASGKAKACRVLSPSGSASLDDIGCRRLIERARYRPARDAAGRPAESVDWIRVQWQAGLG